jgi:high-affinity nickel-transport protein
MTFLALLAVGFFLGMRHATDADHVVAVSTIVSREGTTRSAMLVGALWGLGHTATILVVGGALVIFGLVIPPRLGLSMELSVAIMLIVLGAMNVSGALRRIAEAAHDHNSPVAAAGNPPAVPRRVGLFAGLAHGRRLRPVVVGVVHGLAGSAAVALIVLTTIRDARWAILYLGVFGAGTVLGMMLLTTAMAAPVAAASKRFATFELHLARFTGLGSIAFGLFLAYRIGFVDGLFLDHATWIPR